jgi:hypothetical protein
VFRSGALYSWVLVFDVGSGALRQVGWGKETG